MPRLFPAALFAVAALALSASAAAQVYKWKDANGTTHYSDVPPPAGSKYERVSISSNVATAVAATPTPAGSAAPAAVANAGTQTAQADRIADTPDNRAQLCKQLDSNIALLNSDQPITAGDAETPQHNMSDVQRRQELATAQAQKKQYCQ
ncbi:MAG TPA: DUF4124 domain-containing protein [Rhodanobacteraceae bacterium]|nr:DUF4124 domain-containing protein [Rhodanobacteraceae bacterium]